MIQMKKFECECCDHEVEVASAVIKIHEGKAVYDIKCPCNKYMKLSNPKKGFPSIGGMDKYGRSK